MSTEQPSIEKFKRRTPKLQVVQEEDSQATTDEAELLLTQTQVGELYGLDDYWITSLVRKGKLRKYKVLGKSRPYYSEPQVKEIVAAMTQLGRTLKKLRALFFQDAVAA